jgi:drug/metabolite transporter (DMT)-like permease
LTAPERLGPRLALLAAAILFSTGGAALKATRLGTWEVAGCRAVLGGLTVLALVPAARHGFSRRAWAVAAAYAASGFLFVAANKATTAASTIFLQSTSPLYIAVLGHWLLHERARPRDLVFMAALAVGLAALIWGTPPPSRTAPDPWRGNVLALLCGVAVAVMMVGLRWLARGGTGASAPAAVVLGNLLILAAAAPLALPLRALDGRDVAVLLWLGVFQIGVAYALMLVGLRQVPVLEATLLMFIEPVLSPIWAFLVHGEQAGPWTIAGGAIVLAATAAQMAYARARPPVPAAA